MLTCLRTCSKMLWTVPHKQWRSTTSRRTSLPTSKRSSTRSITLHGTVSWAETSAATSPTRRSTSSTSTWAKWPSSSSSQAEGLLWGTAGQGSGRVKIKVKTRPPLRCPPPTPIWTR